MRLLLGDCLEMMKGLEDNSVDAVITDPPYGMSYQSAWRTATPQFAKIKSDDNIEWFGDFIKEAHRVLKQDTHIYVFCNDYAISAFRDLMECAGFKPKRTLVWVKNNHTSGDLKGDYGNKTEFVLFGHKGRRELNGKRDTNVLNFSRVSQLVHPTEKPVSIMRFLIEKSTNEGETVLDPFMGSGTTGVACKELGREFIGIDMSPEYMEIAKKRIADTQKTMF